MQARKEVNCCSELWPCTPCSYIQYVCLFISFLGSSCRIKWEEDKEEDEEGEEETAQVRWYFGQFNVRASVFPGQSHRMETARMCVNSHYNPLIIPWITTWNVKFALFSLVSSPESTQKKRKRKRGDCGGRVDSEEDAEKKKKKRESMRPNYFVSIPITNTQVRNFS